MRRGEALGLRWSDLDLTAGRASISQTVIMVHHDIQIGAPKTARGRRTVALDPGTVTASGASAAAARRASADGRGFH